MSDDERRAIEVRRPAPQLPALPDPNLLRVVPELGRLAAESTVRATSWSLRMAMHGASAVMKRATSGEPPPAVLQGLASDLRGAAWRALGMPDETDPRGVPEGIAPAGSTSDDLLARGSDLLRRSNDVHVREDTHPAFARILTEITPDEARILRFLYLDGPQPSIDIRTNRPLGIGSELVAGGLSMIAEHAGCRNLDRTDQYLTNLFRLGLIEFSKEQVSNPQRYQLVEAQPKVAEALKRAGRWPRIVHRSIHLNSFGAEFCRTCLPISGAPTSHPPRAEIVPPVH